jgi:hypothetical protein
VNFRSTLWRRTLILCYVYRWRGLASWQTKRQCSNDTLFCWCGIGRQQCDQAEPDRYLDICQQEGADYMVQ